MAVPLIDTNLFDDSNLAFYTRFEGNANDEGPLGLNMTEVGTPSYIAGQSGLGTEIDFGASNSTKYTYVNNDLGITGGSISIGIWVKLNTEIASANWVFGGHSDGGVQVIEEIRYDYNSGAQNLAFVRERAGISGFAVNHSLAMGTVNRYNFIYTYDGTNIIGYVNGTPVGTQADSGNGNDATVIDRTYVGARFSRSSPILFSSSTEDEFFVFKRGLTANEVSGYYLGTLPGRPTGINSYKSLLGVGR